MKEMGINKLKTVARLAKDHFLDFADEVSELLSDRDVAEAEVRIGDMLVVPGIKDKVAVVTDIKKESERRGIVIYKLVDKPFIQVGRYGSLPLECW